MPAVQPLHQCQHCALQMRKRLFRRGAIEVMDVPEFDALQLRGEVGLDGVVMLAALHGHDAVCGFQILQSDFLRKPLVRVC